MIQRALFGAVVAAVALVQTPEQLVVLRILHGALTGVVTAIATMVSLTTPRQHLATVLGMLQAVYWGRLGRCWVGRSRIILGCGHRSPAPVSCWLRIGLL